MCCRYYLDVENDIRLAGIVLPAKAMAAKLGVELKLSGDVYPTETVPVIAPSRTSRTPIVFPMQWGFSHPSREGIFIFNTRAETAADKDLFSASERRCLIPVSGYYEWKKLSKTSAEKYAFSAAEPLCLAGLYVRPANAALPSFSVLTMNAAPAIKDIHARMPVLVTPDQQDAWLNAELPIKDAFDWCAVKDSLIVSRVAL